MSKSSPFVSNLFNPLSFLQRPSFIVSTLVSGLTFPSNALLAQSLQASFMQGPELSGGGARAQA